MISKRSVVLHVGLLALAGALGLRTLTKEDDAGHERHEKELWSVSPEKVHRVELQSATRKVILESKSDEHGRYFVGSVEKEKKAPPKDPHAAAADADAGAPPAAPEVVERETVSFVAGSEAKELVDSLAKLVARRALGKIDPARYEEFGFPKDTETKLSVDLGGKTQELLIGGQTPGGGDVYVRDPKSGEGYVVVGDVARDMEAAESRLVGRNFLAFEEADIAKVTIKGAEAQRELVPVKDQKSFWASPSDPTAKDETASNWMTKLGRLRVTDYVEKAEPPPTLIARVEYRSDQKLLGFLELASQPDGADGKLRYLARSSDTRWYGTVISNVAEQLAEDLPSVLSP